MTQPKPNPDTGLLGSLAKVLHPQTYHEHAAEVVVDPTMSAAEKAHAIAALEQEARAHAAKVGGNDADDAKLHEVAVAKDVLDLPSVRTGKV